MHHNDALIQPAVATILAMSTGRTGSLTAAVVGLTGILIGGVALRGSTAVRTDGDGHRATAGGRATAAIVLGLLGMLGGGVVAATAAGGVGTGNGFGGSIVAMVLGLISLLVGGLARARTREVA